MVQSLLLLELQQDKSLHYGQIYNILGERYVTFDGLAQACAEAILQSPDSVAAHVVLAEFYRVAGHGENKIFVCVQTL